MDISIEQLKQDWDKIHDLDRARSIDAIKRSGTSVRQIAKQIGRSDPLLRHLLTALEAPMVDRALARQGKISTNELVRRAKAAAARRSTMRDQDLAHERQREVLRGSKLISGWLEAKKLTGSYGEQIIEEARTQMMLAELAGKLPSVDQPNNPVAVSLIIERCRPKESLDDATPFVAWYGKWLARWTVFAITDPDTRDQALNLALQTEARR
jgi:hypothetical protein